MLRKSLFITAFLIVNLQAQTIEQIVNSTLEKNYTFKALEDGLNIAKEQIKLSTKWQNPVLSIGATDLQFDDISKRDLEPMQAHFIGISQNIPLGDKLEISESIARNDYKISELLLEDKKLEFKSKIYEYAYNIKLLEERLELFKEFKSNTLKLETLLKDLYKYNRASQIEILNTQILSKELNLKTQNLQTMLNTTKLKLEQLTYEEIENIDFETAIKNIKLLEEIENHPKILEVKENEKKFTNIANLEKEKKNSDIKMNLTYFQRDEKYEDYVNVSFAIPLSIRGSEDIKSLKAKYKSIQIKNQAQDLKLTFKNKIKTLQQNINDSISTFNIIKNEILPKYEELQKTLENYNSVTVFKNIDTKVLIKNQNEIIKYKLKAVDEKQKYFTALAKSAYFKKEN